MICDSVNVADLQLPLLLGKHRALQLSVDSSGALLVAHGEVALRAGEPVTRKLRAIITQRSLGAGFTTLRQERQRGGVSWLGPMARASSLLA